MQFEMPQYLKMFTICYSISVAILVLLSKSEQLVDKLDYAAALLWHGRLSTSVRPSVRDVLRNQTVRLLPNLVCKILLYWRCAPEIIFAKFRHFRFWQVYMHIFTPLPIIDV